MKKVASIVGLGLAVLFTSSAMAAGPYGYPDRYSHADDYFGFYMGASAGSLIYKEQGLDTITPTILQFHFGQQFSPFIAIEGRIGFGINDDNDHGFAVNAEAVYGGYVKGILPIGPAFSLYGLGGVAGTQIHRNYPDFHSSDAGLSYGAGMEAHLGGGASLNAEWVRLTKGTNNNVYNLFDYTVDQLMFGVNWRF